jgi:hypothetical protein
MPAAWAWSLTSWICWQSGVEEKEAGAAGASGAPGAAGLSGSRRAVDAAGARRIVRGLPVYSGSRWRAASLALFLVQVRVDFPLRLLSEQNLQSPYGASLCARADNAHGILAPRQKALHQHRLPVPVEQLPALGFQFGAVGDLGGGGHALTRALGDGLGEQRVPQAHAGQVFLAGDHGEVGGR